jgi:hypothetical protein
MQIDTGIIATIQGLETRDLEAHFGHQFLWATPSTEPGSYDEVVEFYTVTLIRLINVLKGLSAHERMQFLARSRACEGRNERDDEDGLFGQYPHAQ